ncbi:hypothetical protein WG922_13585 [Ramlibacter sp. AN1015]|uniref:hypothetical protein n=1 Tax=Ramlibacter sp. AN1015 TaxID=3133428 RepID=UPI0030BBCB95
MSREILLPRINTPGRRPTTTELALGSLCVNTADGRLFTKISNAGEEAIVEIGSGIVAGSERVAPANTSTAITNSTNPFVIVSIPDSFNAVKLHCSASKVSGGAVYASEVLVGHDGTTAALTEYGVVELGEPLGEWSATLDTAAHYIRITFTPATSAPLEVTVSYTPLQ